MAAVRFATWACARNFFRSSSAATRSCRAKAASRMLYYNPPVAVEDLGMPAPAVRE